MDVVFFLDYLLLIGIILFSSFVFYKNTLINIHIQVSVWIYVFTFLVPYVGVELLGHMVTLI